MSNKFKKQESSIYTLGGFLREQDQLKSLKKEE